MTVYHANAIFRNAKGREVAYRVPLWSGEANDIAGAMTAARDAARTCEALTADVDVVVIKLFGPASYAGRVSLVTATEYAEDLRSGEGSSADQTTLLNDKACDMSADELAKAQADLKQAAIDAVVSKQIAENVKEFHEECNKTVEKFNKSLGKPAWMNGLTDEEIASILSTDVVSGPCGSGVVTVEVPTTSKGFTTFVDTIIGVPEDEAEGALIIKQIERLRKDLLLKTGVRPDRLILGTRAVDELAKTYNLTRERIKHGYIYGMPVSIDEHNPDVVTIKNTLRPK